MTTKLCPTPWFPATDQYILRLRLHRRGGAINVEFRKDSPLAPGRKLIVARTRFGYIGFIAAATSLIATSYWDPTCKVGARPRWNPRAVGFSLRTQNVAKLAEELPRLLNPKSGRPLRQSFEEERAIIAANGGVRPNNIKARLNRHAEIMTACARATMVFEPLHERMQDARRMRGYASGELNALSGRLDTVLQAIQALRRTALVQTTPQTIGRARTPVTSDEIPSQNRTREPFHIDPELFNDELPTQGTPLSPSEERISANLAPPQPTEEEIADVQHRLAYAPTLDDMEQIKREWDARYPKQP